MCVWESRGGRLGSGIPHGKAAQSLPRPVRDPEPKQEAGRPWPGSGPSPDFPRGWGCSDSSPSPFPRFPCLHFSARPRGGRCKPLAAATRTPWPCCPGTHPRAAPAPEVSQGSGSCPLCVPESGGTPPLRVPGPTPSPTVTPGVSSPPPRPVREGKGAGSAGGVTAPARTSASCSLASVPRASWLFRLGRRRRLGAPCRWGRGDFPQRPQPSTHPRGASPPSSASGCSGSRASWKLALVTAPGT